VSVALRILDDGAWLSVNDQRRVSVSELWRVHAPEFCECPLVDFIAEGFTDVSADGRDVAVTTYGKCIACGESGVPRGNSQSATFRTANTATTTANT